MSRLAPQMACLLSPRPHRSPPRQSPPRQSPPRIQTPRLQIPRLQILRLQTPRLLSPPPEYSPPPLLYLAPGRPQAHVCSTPKMHPAPQAAMERPPEVAAIVPRGVN